MVTLGLPWGHVSVTMCIPVTVTLGLPWGHVSVTMCIPVLVTLGLPWDHLVLDVGQTHFEAAQLPPGLVILQPHPSLLRKQPALVEPKLDTRTHSTHIYMYTPFCFSGPCPLPFVGLIL